MQINELNIAYLFNEPHTDENNNRTRPSKAATDQSL